VYIIDEVHMLSTAAFNAFLKTLEEPPHHAIFILATTEKHKVLPTILSRCQIYDFSRISLSDTVDHLRYVAEQENVQAEDEALNVIAQKADGGMRDALSIFDQVVSFTGGNITYKAVIENLNVLDYEYYFRLTENILSEDVVESWLTLNEVLNKGFDGQSFLTGLASHFRDLLLCKDQRTAQLFEVGSSIRDRYIQLAQRCETDFLYKAIEWVNDCDMKYRLSRNKRLLMDLLFVYLCQAVSPNESGDQKKKIIRPIANNTGNTAPVNVNEPRISADESTGRHNVATPQPKSRVYPEKRENAQADIPKVQASKKSISLGGIGISLSSLGQPKEEKKEEKQLITGDQKQPFTQQQLELEWVNHIKELDEEEVLLIQTMNQCTPVLLSNSEFEVVVNNPGQKERLEEKATGILSALRLKMKNFSIRMQVRVSENNEKKLAFTSEEKFRLMVEQNPSLLKLREEFNLDLD
jgi:DNA polymerase-3 subunit gamma/tau